MYFQRSLLIATFLFLGSICHTFAQSYNPVKWEYSYQETDDKNGEIIIKAHLDPDWHTYSQLQSGNGPLPTVFTFVKTPDFDLNGPVVEPDPERKHDATFDADVALFSNDVVFTQKIKRNSKKEFVIMGEVECMLCNNSMCLPPRAYKFTVKVPQNELK